MTEHGPVAAGEHTSEPAPLAAETVVTDRVNPAVQAVEMTVAHSPGRGVGSDPDCAELLDRHDTVLVGRQRGEATFDPGAILPHVGEEGAGCGVFSPRLVPRPRSRR
jgi:hypothetical protein